ncbi:MAG: YciI family protein [Cyanobium sp.]
MPWFVKLETGLVPKAQFDEVIPAHLAWLAELERRGHEPRSGYWADRVGRSGDGAGGMLLFRASDLAEAQTLVQNDPLIIQGCVQWSLHEWTVVFPRPEPLSCETAKPALN